MKRCFSRTATMARWMLCLLCAIWLLPTPTHAAQQPDSPALPIQQGEPPLLPGVAAPALSGTMVMRTYSLDFYRLPGALETEVIRKMAMDVEASITSDMQEIGQGLIGRVSIRFEPAQTGECAIRGLTLSAQRTIRLFYAPGSDPQRIVAILSHELVHQLQHDRYGRAAHQRSDTILLEGMATWGSRAYFSEPDGTPRYQLAVEQARREGTLLPLNTDLESDCRTTTRNVIYDQWASFVEFLMVTYGREQFDAVYLAGKGRAPGSADYQNVYGRSFGELEAEWRSWLILKSNATIRNRLLRI